MLAINWTAVTAIVGVVTVALAVITKLLWPGIKRLRDPTRKRKEESVAYEKQLKVVAKAIDDAAADRLAMATAQSELNELSKQEERLRLAFGNESAVHWLARINREMLRRAFDIARTSSSDPSLGDLIRLGVDEQGLRAFENERDEALRHRKAVVTFKTSDGELRRLADLAQLPSPYDQRFEALLANLRAREGSGVSD